MAFGLSELGIQVEDYFLKPRDFQLRPLVIEHDRAAFLDGKDPGLPLGADGRFQHGKSVNEGKKDGPGPWVIHDLWRGARHISDCFLNRS